MKQIISIGLTLLLLSCNSSDKKGVATNSPTKSICSDKCEAKSKSTDLSCKLTTADKRARIETVIASLKKQVIETKELENGFAYKFIGSDKIIDELAEFVKTERLCCDFFSFNISVSGDATEAWLQITGPAGTKDFITSELTM
jgi:hypothetical protein